MKFSTFLIPLFFALLLSCSTTRNHQRLSELAIEDQKDRRVRNSATSINDAERLKEVYDILENEQLRTSEDHYNAAIVLQHGENPQDYEKAHELAKKAVALDDHNRAAKILIAQSKDRYLRSIDQPQWYGTQRSELGDVEYLQPMDTTAVTEEQRKELGLRTLDEYLAWFNQIHQKQEKSISAFFVTDSLYRAYYPEKRADMIGTMEQLLEKINYPTDALENNISGTVLVEYTIDKDGNVRDPMVAEGLGYGLDEEAIRIISQAKFKNYLDRDIERRSPILFELPENIED